MLTPDRHTNPALSVVNIAGLIIKEVKNDGIVGYNDLLARLKKQTSDSVKHVFHHSLSFLYLMGTIEYISELDALRLTQ